jgi:hypothetical protein
MRILASRAYVDKFQGTSKLADPVIKRIGAACNLFVDEHPQMTPLVVGAQYEAAYTGDTISAIIEGSIDLIYKSPRGHESILVMSSRTSRSSDRTRETMAYLGYRIITDGAVPYSIRSFAETDGFATVTVANNDIAQFEAASELVMFLHASKNKTLHTGLACQMCGYRRLCNAS